jgi:hypothetical protein
MELLKKAQFMIKYHNGGMRRRGKDGPGRWLGPGTAGPCEPKALIASVAEIEGPRWRRVSVTNP